VTPNTLKVQYLEKSWSCYTATVANYYRDSLLRGSTVGCPSDSLASCCLPLPCVYVEWVGLPVVGVSQWSRSWLSAGSHISHCTSPWCQW